MQPFTDEDDRSLLFFRVGISRSFQGSRSPDKSHTYLMPSRINFGSFWSQKSGTRRIPGSDDKEFSRKSRSAGAWSLGRAALWLEFVT